MGMDSLRGQLLLAAPTLIDPNFHRTVVLIAAHGEEGAMGVVLNRRAEATVLEAAPELDELAEIGERLHIGGPVQPAGLVVLAEFEDPGEAAAIAFGDIGFLAATGEGQSGLGPASGLRRTRVFAGHSGWGPEQLEAEIEREDWIVAHATRADVFAEEPEKLWGSVLQRMGGHYALVARMPLDPSVN